MTTAVDTNVLLDVFTQDAKFCTRSAAALRTALKAERGSCKTCGRDVPVASETRTSTSFLTRRGRRVHEALGFCNWLETQADCLLTRDRGFYRSYFSELRVVAPPEI